MSRCINQVFLIGRVGAPPDVRTTATGDRVAIIRLATDSGPRAAGRTEWHRVVAWGLLAREAEREVRTGDWLYVNGPVDYRRWQDRRGRDRHMTEITAVELVPLHDRDPVEPFEWRLT